MSVRCATASARKRPNCATSWIHYVKSMKRLRETATRIVRLLRVCKKRCKKCRTVGVLPQLRPHELLTIPVRKTELRRSVETYESQIDDLRKQVQAAEETSKAATSTLESTKKELERALPFEKEVREKNLLIGKLRHEAVTLNEHLTKALRILKKGRPEDNVDRQIITNYFLHFLAIDRSDPKKFEALQLIAALLGWTDGTCILLSFLSLDAYP